MLRENREDAMVIMITRDGKVYFDRNSVTPDMLPALIREGLVGGAERKVYLQVDAMAKYGVVIWVLAEIRSAGVEKVAFIVEQRPPPEMLADKALLQNSKRSADLRL
jgi:biopolymer transport protein TolR